MVKYILDTNALIALSKNNENFMRRFNNHVLNDDPIITTVLNYYEFARGLSVISNPAVSKIKQYFRKSIKIGPINYEISEIGSKIYKELKSRPKSKHGPDDVDILTASYTIGVKGILITHDSDFNEIAALEGFQIENWELK
ncbi:MAG: PIN domain-containing protein [Ferroplasma sp.]|uniref:PIN domain-containing protein n=1 Tax=Ferroplasma sp. TaxID=2591003 RepID=UPI0028151A66|nr:PIN domain-containing protein [Ferroplasma sp.]WMT51089.1 MAG: PIN domain-containing protein [Ferroplasma sp.]